MKVVIKRPEQNYEIVETDALTVRQCYMSFYEKETLKKFEGKFSVIDVDSDNTLKLAYNHYASLHEHDYNMDYYECDAGKKTEISGLIIFMKVEKQSEIERIVDITENDISFIEHILRLSESGGDIY